MIFCFVRSALNLLGTLYKLIASYAINSVDSKLKLDKTKISVYCDPLPPLLYSRLNITFIYSFLVLPTEWFAPFRIHPLGVPFMLIRSCSIYQSIRHHFHLSTTHILILYRTKRNQKINSIQSNNK